MVKLYRKNDAELLHLFNRLSADVLQPRRITRAIKDHFSSEHYYHSHGAIYHDAGGPGFRRLR